MSEQDNTKKIAYLPPEAIMDVKISGAFFDRIQFVLFNELRRFNDEERKELVERIGEGKPSRSPDEDVVYILFALSGTISDAAQKQNKLQYKEPAVAMEEIQEFMKNMPPMPDDKPRTEFTEGSSR